MAFQQQVHINPALAVAGDFASSNPNIYKIASTGRVVADARGVLVGKFCVLNPDGTCTSDPGTAPPGVAFRIGFVHRENNAQIVTYLAESGQTIQPGQAVAAFGAGDFYAVADKVTGEPVRGAKAFWNPSNGETEFSGTASATRIDTGFVLVSETCAVGDLVIISNTGA